MVPFVTPIAFWKQAAWTPAANPAESGGGVAGERDEPAPGVREVHPAQHRETGVEEPLVALRYHPALRFRDPHSGPVADPLPNQNAMVRGVAHRDPDEAVGGGHPPVLRHPVGRLLGLGQRTGEARLGRHRQDPVRERTEAGRKSVHREDALRGADRPFRGRNPRAVRVLDGDGRGVLVELDVRGEGIGETAHEGDRIHERPAGGVDRAREMTRFRASAASCGPFDPLEGLAEPCERGGEGIEVLRDAAIGDRRLVLPLSRASRSRCRGRRSAPSGRRCRPGRGACTRARLRSRRPNRRWCGEGRSRTPSSGPRPRPTRRPRR